MDERDSSKRPEKPPEPVAGTNETPDAEAAREAARAQYGQRMSYWARRMRKYAPPPKADTDDKKDR